MKQIEQFAARECKKRGIETDLIDLKSIDHSLNYEEQKTQLKSLLDHLQPNITDINVDRLQAEIKEGQELFEKQIIDETNKKFANIEPNKVLDEYYYYLKSYVSIVANSKDIHSLFVIGGHGLGKSHNIMASLAKSGKEYIARSGKMTPRALYELLYENKDKVVFLDDTISLIKDNDCLSILFEALWSPTEQRVIHWNTTRNRDNLPDSFIFSGKIIFCLNEIKDNELMKTLISRCFAYELKFTYDDVINIMTAIASKEGNGLKTEQRQEILTFIKEHTDRSTEEFDLRIQKKAEALYKESNEWRKILLPQLTNDRIKLMAMELSEDEFIKRTGYSRATYYNKKSLKV